MIIFGVIVLYQPEDDVFENMMSYLDALDCLYVIDNSVNKNNRLLERIRGMEKIRYVDVGFNSGIANALNHGAKRASSEGAQWLLTMDQDSKATPGMLEEMLACIDEHQGDNLGIVSPFHADRFNVHGSDEARCRDIKVAMTSGNLLNLEAYRAAGAFRDEFFIDRVDTEYCLRLNKMGYKVIQATRAVLEHHVGEVSRHRFFGRYVYPTNHSPIRQYYIARNRAKLIRMHYRDFPQYCWFEFNRQFVDIAKIIFFEEKKALKLRMIFRGFRDFLRGRYGKIPDEYLR